MNARFHFDWFLNKIIFYTGSLLRTKTLKSSNLTYFFSGVCVFECMIAEIHNSYVFNTFNEYQKEVFPIENTIVVCITRSISMQCFSLLQISIYISNVFIFTFPQHKNTISPIFSMDSHFTLSQQQQVRVNVIVFLFLYFLQYILLYISQWGHLI